MEKKIRETAKPWKMKRAIARDYCIPLQYTTYENVFPK